MDKLIKPATKGKHDGSCDYLCSDDARFIVMRGDYTEAEIIQASVSQDVIDSDSAADFASNARYAITSAGTKLAQ